MILYYFSIILCSPSTGWICTMRLYNKKETKLHFYCIAHCYCIIHCFINLLRYSQLLATPTLIFWPLMLVQCFTNPDLVHQLTQS